MSKASEQHIFTTAFSMNLLGAEPNHHKPALVSSQVTTCPLKNGIQYT